jgi:hypothetical protein
VVAAETGAGSAFGRSHIGRCGIATTCGDFEGVSREVILYTRRECGLCDETAAELQRLRDDLAFTIRTLDIDADPALREQYNDIVPVVAVGDRVLAHAPVDVPALRATLTEAFRG